MRGGCVEDITGLGGSGERMGCGGYYWSRRVRSGKGVWRV